MCFGYVYAQFGVCTVFVLVCVHVCRCSSVFVYTYSTCTCVHRIQKCTLSVRAFVCVFHAGVSGVCMCAYANVICFVCVYVV